ncbi:LysR family transcriptional regulator [Mesorhizobium sp.]|uniref:LysR family transcriptional regulator n=1 Tax=Mesorhizobium sp. TaxID=1871066 RepID=UPI00257AE798|nr:LysR family transcriptional regulator [Mesorhizobium sp.]
MNFMKWYQVEVFQAVMKTGSMTSAARLLNLSQPSISKHIQALEATIGAKLFVREGRGILPTPTATSMFEEVHVLFDQANNIDRLLESISTNAKRRLRIGIPPLLSARFISETLARMKTENKDLAIYIAVKDSAILKNWITSGRLDVAIIGDHIYGSGVNIAKSPMVCIMPVGHALESKAHVEPVDLAEHDYIAFDADSPLQSAIDGVVRDGGIKLYPKAIVTTTPTLVELVGHGMGISVVHPLAMIDSTTKVEVRPFIPEIVWDYKIIVSSTIGTSVRVDHFVDAAKAIATGWLQSFGPRPQPSSESFAGASVGTASPA